MKTRSIIIGICSLFILGCNEKRDNTVRATYSISDIEPFNREIEQSLVSGNIDTLMHVYAHEITIMPDFKAVISSRIGLKQFYELWLDSVSILSYKRKTYQIQALENDLMEIGTFSMTYLYKSDTVAFTGNYMVLWLHDGQGCFKIRSEIFGSDVYMSSEKVPYAHVVVPDTTTRQPNVKDDLKAEVLKVNDQVIQSVVDGDAAARAAGFVSNGICIPRYHEMLTGMDQIKPYMYKIYQPDASLYVAHTFYDTFDYKQYVLVNGHFKGGWGNGNTFEGNMSNLRVRTEDGQLLMYWQLANNDR